MSKKNDKKDFFSGWTAVIIGLLGVVVVCFLAQTAVEYFQGSSSKGFSNYIGSSNFGSEKIDDEDEDIKKAKQMKAAEDSKAENNSDKSKDKNKSSADEQQAQTEKKSKQPPKAEDEKLSIKDKISISNQKLEEGRKFFAEGNLTKAFESFSQAVELYSLNAAAWTERGKISVELQNFDQALHDFNKAIEADSTYADAYNNRGLYYRTFGDEEKAEADFAMNEVLKQSTANR